jgi:hypothetical protein
MTYPCIAITRHYENVYEWEVLYGHQKMDGDIGETSISDCLVAALGTLPNEERLVEISYRGMHMGTYDIRRVSDCPGEIAGTVAETYGVLTHNN